MPQRKDFLKVVVGAIFGKFIRYNPFFILLIIGNKISIINKVILLRI